MQALRFTLTGKTAFFKMPEINSFCYFTYGNIHKVALLGMFGAILGYTGYGAMQKGDSYPEFYERLKEVQIAIVPEKKNKGYISRKIQYYNHSTGAASEEQGGNLIVKEQWLENPVWNIYVKLDCEEAEKIADAIINHRAVYLPYLGANGHPASIRNAVKVSLKEENEYEGCIDSLFIENKVMVDYDDDEIVYPYKYLEYLPTGLQENILQYQLEKMVFTNCSVESVQCEVYRDDNQNIVFI